MKKILSLLAVFMIASLALADDWSDAIAKAHALKAKGDYAGAAEATPRSLCKAIYYWNAACQVVGHKDSKGDWAINDSLTEAQKSEGLRLLGLAADNLTASQNVAGLTAPDDGKCTGVDPVDLRNLIQKVTDCINGNCQ